MGKLKKVKGWAIISKGGVLVGGGTKQFGYEELKVFSTRLGAEENMNPSRNDRIVKCEISYDPETPLIERILEAKRMGIV